MGVRLIGRLDAARAEERPGSWRQSREDIEAAIVGRARAVLLGDSLTNRWRTDGREAWDRVLAPLGCAHLGVGEDRVEHLLHRLESGAYRGLSPVTAVVAIGTNNLPDTSADAVAAGIARVVGHCRAAWPAAVVVVSGILPRRDRGATLMLPRRWAVNRRLAAMADGRRVRYLDPAPLADRLGFLRPGYALDGLHLTPAGYAAWAAILAPVIAGPGSRPGRSGA